jgi:hypothetical protein
MSVKKIVFIFSFLLILSLVGLGGWLNAPLGKADLKQLIPQETFVLVSLRAGYKEAAEYLKFMGYFKSNSGLAHKLKLLALKPLISYFSPLDISVIGVFEPDSSQAAYLIILRNSKLVKLAGLLSKLRSRSGSDKRPRHRIFKDVFIFSKEVSLLDNLGQGGRGRVILEEDPGTPGLFVFAQNKELFLSKMIKGMEQKSSYSIFPSIDSVSLIRGHFDILDSEKAKGDLTFYFKDKAEIGRLGEDVSFLSVFIRRFFKAEGLNFSSKIKKQDDSLSLVFGLLPSSRCQMPDRPPTTNQKIE